MIFFNIFLTSVKASEGQMPGFPGQPVLFYGGSPAGQYFPPQPLIVYPQQSQTIQTPIQPYPQAGQYDLYHQQTIQSRDNGISRQVLAYSSEQKKPEAPKPSPTPVIEKRIYVLPPREEHVSHSNDLSNSVTLAVQNKKIDRLEDDIHSIKSSVAEMKKFSEGNHPSNMEHENEDAEKNNENGDPNAEKAPPLGKLGKKRLSDGETLGKNSKSDRMQESNRIVTDVPQTKKATRIPSGSQEERDDHNEVEEEEEEEEEDDEDDGYQEEEGYDDDSEEGEEDDEEDEDKDDGDIKTKNAHKQSKSSESVQTTLNSSNKFNS
jgi:hypothetical protein